MAEATLKALEQQIEQEVQRWENSAISMGNSAISMGKLLNRIKESGTYQEAGYKHFQPYYHERWEERIGRAWASIRQYMYAARVVGEMEGGDHDPYPVTDFIAAKKLGTIADPKDRVRVWNEHVESGEPSDSRENLDRRIKETKGEPVVRDVLTPEDMADLPAAEFNRAEEKASLTSKIVPRSTDDPEEAAEAAYRLYGENIDRHIRWADDIANWYAKYRDELIARQRQGIRAVK